MTRELPQIIELFRRQSDPPAIITEKNDADVTSPPNIITIVLNEENNKTSSPRRLVDAIESISIIYSVFAEIDGLSGNDLVVLACDSGSDKSFDFTGVPQIIEQTKDFIFGVWDRVILHRERKHSERVKIVAESLPLLGTITEMVDGSKLSAEQGELLKRRIIDGATKFLDTGAIMPELKKASHFEPQALLPPTPTLLLQAPKGATPKRESDNQERRRRRKLEHDEDEEDATAFSPEMGDDDDVGPLSAEEMEIIKSRRRGLEPKEPE
jgi:hypothetical protein